MPSQSAKKELLQGRDSAMADSSDSDVSSRSGVSDSEEELWEEPKKRRRMYSRGKADDEDEGSSKTGIIAFVVILMIALVCAGGYYLYKDSKSGSSAEESTSGGGTGDVDQPSETGGAVVPATGSPTEKASATSSSSNGAQNSTASPTLAANTTAVGAAPNSTANSIANSTDAGATGAAKSPDGTPTPIVTPAAETPKPESTDPATPEKKQPSLELWKERVLAGHNTVRKLHFAPDLEYDDGLAEKATTWAESCSTAPSRDTLQGNSQAITPAQPDLIDPVTAIWTWASEEKDHYYKFSMPSDQTEHFTRVVWVATKKVGCALKQCPDMTFVTYLYDPEGNDPEKIEENVKQPTDIDVAHPARWR